MTNPRTRAGAALARGRFKVTEDIAWSINRVACERKLRAYVEQAWPWIDRQQFIPGWHIDAICDHLEAVMRFEIPNLVINVPPRHSKSMLVSVFWPTWIWGPAGLPMRQFLTSSHSLKFALRDNVKARRLMQSRWYQERWGSTFQMTGDQNAKERYENNQGGYRLAIGVGQGTGEGGDYFICDDPNRIDGDSDVKRENVIEWWDGTMATRGNDPRRSGRVVIMQRTAQNDLSGHLEKLGEYEMLVLPAEYEPNRRCRTSLFTDPRRKEGELLCPARFDAKTQEKLKLKLGNRYAAIQQQRPTPAGGLIWLRSWFRRYMRRPENLDFVFQSWDMAFKDLKTSDYVVGQVWGAVGPDLYLLDQDRGQWRFSETLERIHDVSKRWPDARGKYIEDKANGTGVMDMARKSIQGIVAYEPNGSKIARAEAVAPIIKAGNIFIPDVSIAPWIEEYLDEIENFPRGAHDDQVDATSQALDVASKEIARLAEYTTPPSAVDKTSTWIDRNRSFESERDDLETESRWRR